MAVTAEATCAGCSCLEAAPRPRGEGIAYSSRREQEKRRGPNELKGQMATYESRAMVRGHASGCCDLRCPQAPGSPP